MVISRKYGKAFTQSDDYNNRTATWSNLSNLEVSDSQYANCSNISNSNDPNSKPATLYITDFGFDIPVGASITHIRVGYKDYYSGNLIMSSPLIRVLNGYGSAYGGVVQNQNNSVEKIISRDNNQLTAEQVNTNDFGVSFEYPTNNGNIGNLYLDYVWIEIEYSLPSYFLNIVSDTDTVSVGETFNVTIDLKNNNPDNFGDYVASINLYLPESVEFVRKISGKGTISQDLKWHTLLSNTVSTITFECRAVNEDPSTIISAEERVTGAMNTTKISILDVAINFTCNIPDYVAVGDTITFTVKGTTTARTSSLIYVSCELPECLTFVSDDGDAYYVPEDEEITFDFGNDGVGECEFTCTVLDDPGDYNLTLTYNNTFNFPFTVLSEITFPYYTKIQLDNNTLDLMEDGVTYTISSYMKILERTVSETVGNGPFNYRMIVTQDISDTTEYIKSTMLTETEKYIRKDVTFTYETGKPVYILFTGGYDTNELLDILFTEPQVIETSYFEGLMERGLFPKPLHNILSDVNNAHVTIPAGEQTGKIRLSDIDWSGFTDLKDIIIHEIKVMFFTANNLPIIASAKLITTDQTVERSEIIDVSENNITIGEDYDIWNMKHENLDKLTDLEIELEIKNTYNYPVNVDLRNFYIQFKYIELENANAVGFSIDGDHSKYYGIFMNDRDLGLGFNSTVKEHREDGSDNVISYLQNVKSKTITLEWVIQACTMDEAVILSDKFTKLITTTRTRNNKPIPKKLRFDDLPGRYWEYICEDEIDWDPNSNHKCKVKLTVPRGVAERENEKVSGATGYIESITKVQPIILLNARNNENITITDTITGQTLTIRDNTILTGDTIQINCKNRTVERIVGINSMDITSSVDLNSDFFSLTEDYDFDCKNTAVVQSVRYRETI